MENNEIKAAAQYLVKIGWNARNLPIGANLHSLPRVARIIEQLTMRGYEFDSYLPLNNANEFGAVYQFGCGVIENEK